DRDGSTGTLEVVRRPERTPPILLAPLIERRQLGVKPNIDICHRPQVVVGLDRLEENVPDVTVVGLHYPGERNVPRTANNQFDRGPAGGRERSILLDARLAQGAVKVDLRAG